MNVIIQINIVYCLLKYIIKLVCMPIVTKIAARVDISCTCRQDAPNQLHVSLLLCSPVGGSKLKKVTDCRNGSVPGDVRSLPQL